MSPTFLTLESVVAIHQLQLDEFGGSPGIRDKGLLESAVNQASASYGGRFLHQDLFEMAAAYLFHIVQNHLFVDGNKRAGLASALTFLHVNGLDISAADPLHLYRITIEVAQGRMKKPAVAKELASLVEPPTASA